MQVRKFVRYLTDTSARLIWYHRKIVIAKTDSKVHATYIITFGAVYEQLWAKNAVSYVLPILPMVVPLSLRD